MSDALTPEETAVWRSLMVFWRQGLPQLERTFRRVGLSHLEYGFLAVLAEAPGGEMSAGELADLAGISASRLSHRLNHLEERGDVARRADPNDRRGVRVALTPQGAERAESVRTQHIRDIRGLVFDHLSAGQVEALADAVTVIASRLTDHRFLSDYSER